MPSSSLPIGGRMYQYLGYNPSYNNEILRHHPPGPPPGSPANSQRLTIETEMMMVSLTKR